MATRNDFRLAVRVVLSRVARKMDQVREALIELRSAACQADPASFSEAWLSTKQSLDEFGASPENGPLVLELLLSESDTSIITTLKEAKRNHAISGAGEGRMSNLGAGAIPRPLHPAPRAIPREQPNPIDDPSAS